MITVKAKKKYIEEIDRLLIMSNLEYTKNNRMYEINSSLHTINDLLKGYIKLTDEQKEELYKNDNGGINLYIDKVEDKYNPERNYNSYQIKDIDKDGNPTELVEDNTYDDIDEIFL